MLLVYGDLEFVKLYHLVYDHLVIVRLSHCLVIVCFLCASVVCCIAVTATACARCLPGGKVTTGAAEQDTQLVGPT